jgi:hypothetical protein
MELKVKIALRGAFFLNGTYPSTLTHTLYSPHSRIARINNLLLPNLRMDASLSCVLNKYNKIVQLYSKCVPRIPRVP